jgi:hypothetical protein
MAGALPPGFEAGDDRDRGSIPRLTSFISTNGRVIDDFEAENDRARSLRGVGSDDSIVHSFAAIAPP